MKYSVVVPCYKSALSIRQVVELTIEEFEKLGINDYEFVLVDDFSPDGGETVRELRAVADDHACVKVIELAKNGGQQNASMAGLNYATGDAIISMDDDLQTHPSQLHLLIEEFNKGFDMVYGYYPEKKHSLFRNFGSYVNFMTVRMLIGKPKELKTSSFWIMRKFVRDYIIQYKSNYTYLQGLILRTTRTISCIPVKHFERAYGSSGYTLKKLLKLYSNILGYSVVPLRAASYMGGFFSVVGIVGALIVLIRKLIIPTTAVGWSSVMCAIFFFSGMIMLFLGLIGEYLGRMFLGMSHYPQFVVKNVYTKKED